MLNSYKTHIDESWCSEINKKELDKSNYYEIVGLDGKLWKYSETKLAVLWTPTVDILIPETWIRQISKKQPNWTIKQNGDSEVVWLLPNTEAAFALALIKALKK